MLQYNGAKANLADNDASFKAKVTELFGDLDAVKRYTQPPQSPALIVNDLDFLESLQPRYYGTSLKNSIELIKRVEDAY
jgi:hypothetical protein